ncbi:MAG: hypothetical protein ABI040_06575, partial [Rhodoferax sp.]
SEAGRLEQAERSFAAALSLAPPRFGMVLDLGCGTGLIGPLIKPVADRVDGVNLSLASDVFVYLGALDAVLAGAARVLAPGGLFAFSIERTTDAHDLRLLPSLRYAHSQACVRRLAQEHGFEVRAAFAAPMREDQRRPIEGPYVYLQAR